MKQFSTARNSQRAAQSYIKRRGMREIEVIRRRKGGVKRRENNIASKQITKCSPQPGTPRYSQNYVENRRGIKEIEVTWRRKGRDKRGESNQAGNQIPK